MLTVEALKDKRAELEKQGQAILTRLNQIKQAETAGANALHSVQGQIALIDEMLAAEEAPAEPKLVEDAPDGE